MKQSNIDKEYSIYSKFTNKYPISKTLKFELIPIGESREYIKNNNILEEDKKRADDYVKAKKILDEAHREFINYGLTNLVFEQSELEKFNNLYQENKNDRDDKTQKLLYEQQNKLRKVVANKFKNNLLFKKDIIRQILPEWMVKKDSELLERLRKHKIDNPKEIIESFSNWTSYFVGYHNTRKNIYTEKDVQTSIGYRLIHDNLPKFLDNIDRYEQAKKHAIDFSEVEDIFNVRLDDIFTLEGFNQYLTQESIDQYNSIIGGINQKDGTKQKGVNEIINLYVQQIDLEISKVSDEKKKELNAKKKVVRSCKIEQLYKQILSDCNTISFRGNEPIKDDAELCKLIKNISSLNNNIDDDVKECLSILREIDTKCVYIRNDRSITDISKYLFSDWSVISSSLKYYNGGKMSKQSYFSFYDIHKALEEYFKQYTDDNLKFNEDIKKQKKIAINEPLFGYFIVEDYIEKKFEDIRASYEVLLPLLKKYENAKDERLKKGKKELKVIKDYFDNLKELQHFLKPLHFQLKKKEKEQTEVYEKDNGFYSEFDELYKKIGGIIPLYNQIRNYLTKKPYKMDKFKLNFENKSLARGWDENTESTNTCVILLKDENYFLGIMDKKYKNIFKDKNKPGKDEKYYQKMVYKLLPGPNKMLPKVFFSKKNIDYYSPSQEILDIRNYSSYSKGGNPQSGYTKKDFALDDMRKMVDFYKKSITKHPDWKGFNFQFSLTEDYKDISEFYREVEGQGYKITFVNISQDYIDECVEQGKLYLFQIYTKDFSSKSKGSPNLQTLYWKALFDKENLKDVVYKLNGEPELFYRKASISYSAQEWKTGHHLNDSKKKQKYPIVKDRHYAKHTYLFHVPVTCNFKANKIPKFNNQVQEFLKGNSDVNIIGIHRGERNLIYITIINQKGEILQQDSLNVINDIDYHNLLDQREKERDKARKSWETIEKIKDLKGGYLSQVVHKIAKLMIEHNAIVVFEDLNFDFKNSRKKIEKQIYQNFEKAIINKLSYLVFKDREANEIGGLLKPLQLTTPFESFKKLRKQTGFIFYVPAYHTSKICPATGFVNLLYPKYETIKKSQEFFGNFDKICFNKRKRYFEFHFNYKKFTNKAEGNKQNWIVCSYGERLKNFRDKQKNNNWNTHEVHLNREMKKLFGEYDIDFENSNCLKNEIIQQNDRKFFKSLIDLLKLTLQMVNIRIGTKEDWLISPVKDENGKFFDSRKVKDNSIPKNIDANGSYHIALKGYMLLQQLNNEENINIKSNKIWYKFLQNFHNKVK